MNHPTLFDDTRAARRRAQAAIEFEKFDSDNPEVWSLFQRFAFEAFVAGHRRFSADAILHRIRWQTSVEMVAAGGAARLRFKINDHFSAFYARKFARCHPAQSDFFELRSRARAS